jgi:hypothetical protein
MLSVATCSRAHNVKISHPWPVLISVPRENAGLEYFLGTNVHFVTYQVALNGGHWLMNTEFKNEVFSSFEANPIRMCSHCGEKLALIRTMLNSLNGRTIRMFKCECGEKTWSEDKG